ncbi:MAG TPA: c-type cytochrome [Polyangia bacterium]|jgi:hypothetical protein
MTAQTSNLISMVGAATLLGLGTGCTKTMIDAVGGTGGATFDGNVGFGSGGTDFTGTGGFDFTGTGGDACSTTGPLGGSGGSFGATMLTQGAPVFDGVVTASVPPPPISGGTLIVLADGVTAVASDPDRDRIYVVDISTHQVKSTIALDAHDEPGRLVQDGSGLVHVALRGSGAIATIDPSAGTLTMRRTACTLPRGIAYDGAKNVLYLACASGTLLTFTPTGTTPTATWTLPQDLRDVIVDGPRLLVTRFRSAEMLVLDENGQTTEVIRPVDFANPFVHGGTPFEPAVAWRAAPVPGGGAVMVHQRGMHGTVMPSPGGYGGLSTCDTIVHTAVCKMMHGHVPAAGPAIPGFVLPVDIAVSPDGQKVALVAAGNGHATFGSARRLWVTGMDDATSDFPDGCSQDEKHGPMTHPFCVGDGGGTGGVGGATGSVFGSGGVSGTGGSGGSSGGTMSVDGGTSSADGGTPSSDGGVSNIVCGTEVTKEGEPIAVAFAGQTVVLVQTREPAQLLIEIDVGLPTENEVVISLSSESRADTGHALFHANSGGGLACASCHAEGHDDGRTWDFACEGQRRTQDPSGGLIGTEPFHWNGDMKDFPTLFTNVFVERMSGPVLPDEYVRSLQSWVNVIPAKQPLRSASDAQVMRGQALFTSPAVGCSTCHAGAKLTNNSSVSVGTNGMFQVPSLTGLGWRAPYMHDGCAASLADRFTDVTCGGGDAHGMTSNLSSADVGDLVAFLQSL